MTTVSHLYLFSIWGEMSKHDHSITPVQVQYLKRDVWTWPQYHTCTGSVFEERCLNVITISHPYRFSIWGEMSKHDHSITPAMSKTVHQHQVYVQQETATSYRSALLFEMFIATGVLLFFWIALKLHTHWFRVLISLSLAGSKLYCLVTEAHVC